MRGAGGGQTRGAAGEAADGRQVRTRHGPGRGLILPAVILVALAIAVSLIGRAIFDRQAADLRSESASALQAIWRAQNDQISQMVSDERHDAALHARAPEIVRSLQGSLAAVPEGPPLKAMREALDLYRDGHDYAAIIVLDDELRLVATSPGSGDNRRDVTRRQRELAGEALQQDRLMFSDVYLERGGKPVMDFAAPIHRPRGRASAPLGVLLVSHDAEVVLFPILQAWPASMKTGESVLAEVRGDEVVSLNPLPVGGRESLSFTRPVSDTRLPVVMAVQGRTGTVEGVDYRGEPVIASVGGVPGTPWFLAAKQDLAVIDEPVADRAWATLAWVIAIIALAGAVLLFYWRTREARALRELVTAEGDRRQAEARYAALMREAKEIVLLLDAGGVIVEANDHALQMYGYSRRDLVGQSVDAVSAAPSGVPVEERRRALDASDHLTLESVHRRSDGVEFPVEVGVSSVVIEGEQYYLEVVRDVGERKAAEAALRDSEARYRTLFENALSGFALQEVVLDDEGRPVDFIILAANPAFTAQTGLEVPDVVGRRASEVVPGIYDSDLVERGGRVALTGVSERAESFLPGLGRHLDIQFASPRPGQFATIIVDVTLRREAEEILSGFFGSSPVGLFILDRDSRYVRVNQTLAALNRLPAEDHLGRTVRDVAPHVDEAMGAAFAAVAETGEALHGLELSGAQSPWEEGAMRALVSVFPICDPGGVVRFVGGVVVDVTRAKRAERELEQNRAFLEQVLGVTPDLIYVFDIVEQKNVFSNKEMLDLLGYAPEEVVSMDAEVLARLLHPDDREVMAAHHRRARDLADGDVLEVEYRMRRADGEWRTLHGRDTVFARDDEGQVAQLIGTAHDVTRQRVAERELVGLSQRFEATVMASPLAIVALDGDRRVRLWNPAATRMLGWSTSEVMGEPAPFFPPELRDQTEDLERRLGAGEQFAGLDLPCVRKDGVRLHTSVSPALTRGEDGRSDGVLLIIEDVTERRANVVRLARLTRLYKVLSAVTEAIPREREPERLYEEVCRVVVEQGGFRLAWVGRRRRGGPVQSLACAGPEGALDDLVIDMRLPEGELSALGTALLRGRSDVCRDVASDPRMAPFRAHAEKWGLRSAAAVPIVAGGRHDAALAIYSAEPGRFDAEEVGLLERLAADVGFAIEAAGRERARRTAERKLEALNASLERRVRERTDELQAANAELEAFSYSVSHDLRAPLRALDGFSLALLEDCAGRLDEEGADYLTRIRGASQRMARLIDDLLMLSRVTRRGMTRETLDLSALARSVGDDLSADDAGRQVEFTVAADMEVDGDPHLLDVALRNLLGNAWKFTSRTDGARVDVGVDGQGDERVFYVRDNGAGFDPQYGDQLFAPFQRLHGEDEFPGTGIGLATVQRIVRRHGGRVWAEGAPGKGATVWFTLGPWGEAE